MPKKQNPRKKDSSELDQIDEAYRNLSGKKTKKKKASGNSRMITIIIILAAILVVAVGIVAGIHFFSGAFAPPTVPENVTVAGVNIGGLEREEATQAVADAVEDYYDNKEMVVTIGEHSITINADTIGATVNVDAIVDAAFALSETEDPAAQLSIDPAAYLSVNEYAIAEAMKAFETFYPTTVIEHTWEVVDVADTTADDDTAAPEKKLKLVITMGESAYDLDVNVVADAAINQIYRNEFTYETQCNIVEPQPLDLEAIYNQFCTQAVNAVMDPETFEVSDHVYGYAFSLEAAKEAMATAQSGDVLEFPFETIFPEITKESLSGLLFKDVLASYTAKSGSNPNRNVNLKLSCQAVNGLILYPGDVFNYNQTLGQRTEAKGYKPAASYVGGETVDTVGGGICQTSSSIYYCALLADLEIVQRHNHAYISSYMPFGMDATVDWSGPNFRFKNNTNYPIKIEAKASYGNVTIKLLGTDEKDYYVKMKYEVVEKTPWETVYVDVKESENEKGYTDGQVISTPYTGYEIKTYKYKYDKETNELISKTLQTHDKYAKRDKKIVRIIKDTPEPTTPTTPTNPPTEPTNPPTEPTNPPTEPTNPPTEPTNPPTEPTNPPTEPTTPPADQEISSVAGYRRKKTLI